METVYIIEVELGEQEVDLHYLENGTLVKTVMDKENKGYLPETMPESARQFIRQKYPRANVIEVDRERIAENRDLDGRVKKDVVFNHQNVWVVTTWEVRQSEVPANVMNVLKTSAYANYRIDDIDYEERADGTNVYIFEMEQGNKEVYVTINANSLEVISTAPKN